VRGVRMVGGLLVVSGVVMFASFCVVLSSMCCVFCCLFVVLGCFLGHGVFPLFSCPLTGLTPRGNNETRVSAKRSFVTWPCCSLPANHFVQGNKRSQDQSHNAKKGDAKINALHAVGLVLPDNPSVSGWFRWAPSFKFPATPIPLAVTVNRYDARTDPSQWCKYARGDCGRPGRRRYHHSVRLRQMESSPGQTHS
jgi:hypothetical protein